MNTLVFDIETVPDTALGRRLFDLPQLPEADVADVMFARQRQRTGGDFLPYEQQRIVAISAALRSRDQLRIWSLGAASDSEKNLIERFFDGLDRFTPDLVSWNGSGFDLPVLHYRSLLHGVTAKRYWEVGAEDTSFRYNSYLGRFHWRHMDLMDILSGFQGRGRAGLHDVSILLGFPGKLGMHGSEVWDAHQRGEIDRIRAYCETDVLNTYLIFLRFELIRGNLSADQHAQEEARVRSLLRSSDALHWREFDSAWH